MWCLTEKMSKWALLQQPVEVNMTLSHHRYRISVRISQTSSVLILSSLLIMPVHVRR